MECPKCRKQMKYEEVEASEVIGSSGSATFVGSSCAASKPKEKYFRCESCGIIKRIEE